MTTEATATSPAHARRDQHRSGQASMDCSVGASWINRTTSRARRRDPDAGTSGHVAHVSVIPTPAVSAVTGRDAVDMSSTSSMTCLDLGHRVMTSLRWRTPAPMSYRRNHDIARRLPRLVVHDGGMASQPSSPDTQYIVSIDGAGDGQGSAVAPTWADATPDGHLAGPSDGAMTRTHVHGAESPQR